LWTIPDLVAFENQERAEVFRNALRALCKDLEYKMTAMRDSRNKCWKHTTNNESIAKLSRLSLPLTISTIERCPKLQVRCEEILSDSQNRCVEGEIPMASQNNLTIIPAVSLLENSQHYVESDQAAQSETSQLAAEAHIGMSKLDFDAMGINAVPADVKSNCQSTRGDKRQKEMLSAKRSLNHRQQQLRPNEGQTRHHAQKERIERKFSARRAPKHEHSSVYSRNEIRHRMRRKHRHHAEWRDGEYRWQDKEQCRRKHRPKLGSAKMNQSNKGTWSRFWLLCTILLRGCFGESRKSV
jgi:hypothetical protein